MKWGSTAPMDELPEPVVKHSMTDRSVIHTTADGLSLALDTSVFAASNGMDRYPRFPISNDQVGVEDLTRAAHELGYHAHYRVRNERMTWDDGKEFQFTTLVFSAVVNGRAYNQALRLDDTSRPKMFANNKAGADEHREYMGRLIASNVLRRAGVWDEVYAHVLPPDQRGDHQLGPAHSR